MRPTPPARLVVLFLLALFACGEDPALPAERALRSGDLERAGALIAALPGEAGDRLREELDRATRRRAEELQRVEEVLAGIPELSRFEVQERLGDLRRASGDAAVRAEIDARLSSLADLYARASSRRVAEAEDAGAEHEPRARTRRDAAAVETPAPGAPTAPRFDAPRFDAPRAEVPPPSAPSSPADSEQKAAVAAAEPAPPAPTWTPPERVVGLLAAASRVPAARDALRAGDLSGARSALVAAGAGARTPEERELLLGLATDVEDRLLLREELAAAHASSPERFDGLELTELDLLGVTLAGRREPWDALALATLEELADRARLSARAEVGLVIERLARDDVDAAWARLDRLQKDGLVSAADADGLIARFLGERVPEGGYELVDGRLVTQRELDLAGRDDRVSALVERLAAVKAGRVDELAELARALTAEEARPELAAALEARWAATSAKLSADDTARRVERIAEARAALDRARAAALELIFDEERYFYPYDPPECPPDRAALYAGVQREVDVLVNAVREAWDFDRTVSIGKDFRALREEALWIQAAAQDAGAELDPALPPEWLGGLGEREEIDLQTFAWSAAERASLDRDEAVRALNRRRFAAGEWPADLPIAEPNAEERLLVERTNEYRRMMGRRALAWNARVQAAAQDHSDYMSRTGDFGHFEPTPETRTPRDRMQRRGYSAGIGENCAQTGGAESALLGWMHSSGHHRNLLMPDHKEIACAVAGVYWTQNFGGGRDFESEL